MPDRGRERPSNGITTWIFHVFSPHLYSVHSWTFHHLPRPTFPRSLLLVKHSCRPGPRQLSFKKNGLSIRSIRYTQAFAAQAMALGLGLPQHFFDALTDRSFWCVRVIGYPALHREQLNLSCGEHTDYGCWTILAQVGGSPGHQKITKKHQNPR